MQSRKRLAIAACVVVIVALCSPRPCALASAVTKVSCESLTGLKIEAKKIGQPTKGATVISAALIAATPRTDKAMVTPEYCRVQGVINPVDSEAPPIKFEVLSGICRPSNGRCCLYLSTKN